jgi:hypothetical protein
MNSTVREAMFRLLGVTSLLGSSACGGSAANAVDASAGGVDGTAGDDSSSMDHGMSDANLGDTGQADAASDARTNLDADAGVVAEVGAACVTDSVTFRMLVAPTSSSAFCSYFSTPITATWIGVRPAEGAGIAIADPCPTVSACGSCSCNGGLGYGFLGRGRRRDRLERSVLRERRGGVRPVRDVRPVRHAGLRAAGELRRHVLRIPASVGWRMRHLEDRVRRHALHLAARGRRRDRGGGLRALEARVLFARQQARGALGIPQGPGDKEPLAPGEST